MPPEPASKTIAQRSYNALLWNYFGTGVRMSSQFLIGIVLARLLGPQSFGVVAIGWLMVGIGNLVADFGFSAALIQCKDIAEKDIRFAMTVQVALGAFLTLAGYSAADAIAVFFHHADAAPVIRAMAFLFFLQSFGQTAGAMLRRSLNFKAYQGMNIASYLCGYLLVGIPCACFSLGPWSLVAAQLVQSSMFSLAAMGYSKLPMRPTLKPASPGLFTFGGKVVAANLCSWGLISLDSLMVGHMLGVVNLGVYNRAMVLLATPINTLTGSLQGVLFAASSRTHGDTERLKKAFLAASTVLGLICLPLSLTVASVPETVVIGIYGEKWLAAIPVLVPLALAMAVNALLSVVGPVLMAQNKVALELRAQIISLLLMLPVVYFAAQQSLQAVAWGMLGVYLLRWFLLVRAILGSLHAGWAELFQPMRWSLLCAIATATLTWAADQALQSISPFARLIGDMAIAAFILFVLLKIFSSQILQGPHGDYLLGHGRLPILFQRWIGVYHG